MTLRTLCFLLLASALAASATRPIQADEIEFNRDIRPILSNNCFYCHGFDEGHREADLRLDTFEAATEYAIVPGKPDESEVLERMLSDDPDLVMPPPSSEKQLSKKEKELVRRWIEQGAKYQEHWAWSPLTRPTPPDLSFLDSDSPIDAFLRDGWIANDAEPVGLATPRQRLRRLSLDLRGFPPSQDEVDRFQHDSSDEAFFAFRDRWMKELSFAEHQAVRWLDLVRWADTSGFVSDEPIASGAYRAWVIRAFSNNMPFDQFTRDQLAGDLQPNPTDDQYVASGYNRIVNTNCEAGGIEAEQLYKLKGEHVRAFGTVWLGMTTGCAECHDHKFDPFSARDYYSLAAFFDDLVETGVYTPGDRREPLHYVHNDETVRQLDRRIEAEITSLQKEIDAGIKTLDDAKRETLIADVKKALGDKANREEFVWLAGRLPAMRILEGDFDRSQREGRDVRVTTASDGKLARHHAAEVMTGYLSVSKSKEETKDAWFVDIWIDKQQRPEMIAVQISNGKYGRLGWKTGNYETYYWGEDSESILGQSYPWSNAKRVKRLGDLPEENGWVRLRIPHHELIAPDKSQAFEKVGMAWMHVGGRVEWADSGLEATVSRAMSLRLAEIATRAWWETPVNRQFFQRRDGYVASAIRKSAGSRDSLEQELVGRALAEWSQPGKVERLRALESELFEHRARALPVLVSRVSDKPKQTRLLNRGDYQDESGPLLFAAYPEFLTAADDSSKPVGNRLDLANWLFEDAEGLVARVMVNRLWHQYYGRGISESLEDAGTQGDWPSHLQLLDWLACEFRESGWDRNHVIRILTSAKAYQMSSTPSEELAERDPGNRWHARQGRFRMTAEQIRDTALRSAGLLQATNEIPVDSFFPYQPSAYWTRSDKVMYGSRHMVWATSPEVSQYTRTLYTFWKRQNIHPTMLAFDAPTRQECTAKRNVTNTPGQALALLNDPMFVEAGRVLAQRVCDAATSKAERLDELYSRTLQRKPQPAEVEVLESLLDDQLRYYAEHPEMAIELVSIGQSTTVESDAAAEIAAWTAVARSVLNLHEFLTRQ